MNNKRMYGFFLGVPSLFMVVTFVLPIGYMVYLAFQTSDLGVLQGFSFDNVKRFFGDSYYVNNVLGLSLKLGLQSAIFSVLFGYPVALVIARVENQRMKTFLMVMSIIPLWVNTVVRTLAWQIILADNGIINNFIQAIGLNPLKFASSELGTLIGLIQISIPYVILPLIGVLEAMPSTLEESAYSVGASPTRTFLTVTLPLSMPGLISGTMIVFALNAGAYSIPIMLGGGKVRMLAVVSYEQAMASGNLPFAAFLGLILMLSCMIIVIVSQKISNKLYYGK